MSDVTATVIYDYLLDYVTDPAVIQLGDLCVAGRWESMGELRAADIGYGRPVGPAYQVMPVREGATFPPVVCRVGRVGVVVWAEGATWDEVFSRVRAKVAGEKWARRERQGSKAPPNSGKGRRSRENEAKTPCYRAGGKGPGTRRDARTGRRG